MEEVWLTKEERERIEKKFANVDLSGFKEAINYQVSVLNDFTKVFAPDLNGLEKMKTFQVRTLRDIREALKPKSCLNLKELATPKRLLELIEHDIRGNRVTDETLKEWAEMLINAIVDSNDPSEISGDVINWIIGKEKVCFLRRNRNRKYTHNNIMCARWHNLGVYVYGEVKAFYPDMDRITKPNLSYWKDIGINIVNGGNTGSQQIEQAKEAFRLKYGEYIEDIDAFFAKTETIKARELKGIYDKRINGSGIKGKEFLDDFLAVAPERKEGANRITYNNYKTY